MISVVPTPLLLSSNFCCCTFWQYSLNRLLLLGNTFFDFHSIQRSEMDRKLYP